jgi:hypothetical protein
MFCPDAIVGRWRRDDCRRGARFGYSVWQRTVEARLGCRTTSGRLERGHLVAELLDVSRALVTQTGSQELCDEIVNRHQRARRVRLVAGAVADRRAPRQVLSPEQRQAELASGQRIHDVGPIPGGRLNPAS